MTSLCPLYKLTRMEGIGPYIRRRRDELDLSLRELAKKLDCSPAFISDIELGRRHPSDKVLVEIARILKVKIEELRNMDVRPPTEEIKRITQNDPTFALAFRTVVDRINETNISALMNFWSFSGKRRGERKAREKMKPFRSGETYKAPYFTPSQIDNMCCDELRRVGLLPSSPEPVRIDRFIEKRFNVSPQYEDMPNGVLGFTRFGKNGVKAIVISAALDAEVGKVAGRRVRTTIAHEGGPWRGTRAPVRAR